MEFFYNLILLFLNERSDEWLWCFYACIALIILSLNPFSHDIKSWACYSMYLAYYHIKNRKANCMSIYPKRPEMLLKVIESCRSSHVKCCCALSLYLDESDTPSADADSWSTLVMIDRKYWFISPPHTVMGGHSSFFLSHNGEWNMKCYYAFLQGRWTFVKLFSQLSFKNKKCRFCFFGFIAAAVLFVWTYMWCKLGTRQLGDIN